MSQGSMDNESGTLLGYTENIADANLLAGRHFAAYWLRDFFCWEHCHPDNMDKLRKGVSMLVPEDYSAHKDFLTEIHCILNKNDQGNDFAPRINEFCQKHCDLVAQLYNNNRVLTGEGNKKPGLPFYTIERYIPPKPVPHESLCGPLTFLSRYEHGYMAVGGRALRQAIGEDA